MKNPFSKLVSQGWHLIHPPLQNRPAHCRAKEQTMSKESIKQTRDIGGGNAPASVQTHIAKASAKPTSKQTRNIGVGNEPVSVQVHLAKLA
jgi:hypothetical protein